MFTVVRVLLSRPMRTLLLPARLPPKCPPKVTCSWLCWLLLPMERVPAGVVTPVLWPRP